MEDAFDLTNLPDGDVGLIGDLLFSGNGTDGFNFGNGLEVHQEDNNNSLMVVRILVCALGLMGNMMVIFVILALKEYQKAVTHWYVLQLALADSIFLLTLPFKVVEDVHGEWIFSGGMCKVKETILFLNYYSSVLFLMVMSVDRYIAVCHAFSERLQKLRTKCAAFTITLIIWITALLMCIPIMLYSDKRGLDPNCKCQYEFPKPSMTPEELCKDEMFESEEALEDCVALHEERSEELCRKADLSGLLAILNSLEEEELSATTVTLNDVATHAYEIKYQMGCSYADTGNMWIGYLCFNFVVMFIIPFMIMLICYCSIALRLKKARVRQINVTNESSGGAPVTTSGRPERKRTKSAASTKAEKNRIRVTFVCLILVLLFLVCWLPFHVIHLAKIEGVEGSPAFCANLSAVSAVIAYLNSALNPYIYNFIGTRFGKRMRSAAGSVKRSVKKRTSSVSSGGGTVRYHTRKQGRGGTSSTNSATVMTKIYRGRSELETPNDPQSSDLTHVQESFIRD